MAVFRELVTKLSFKVDKGGIEQFNRTIVKFKKQLISVKTAVASFVGGILFTVSKVSDAILNTNELADAIGLAREDLIGLQRAGQKFRINSQEFSSGLISVNNLLRQAKAGFGELERIAREGNIEIRDYNGSLLGTEQVLYNILEALSKVQNEQDRLDLAKQIFGNERFSFLAKAGTDELIRLKNELKPLKSELDKATETAERFENSWFNLSKTFRDFYLRAFPPVFDALSTLFDKLNEFIDSAKSGVVNEFFKPITRETIKQVATNAVVDQRESRGFLSDFFRPAPNLRNTGSNQVEVRNSINVTVSPGTEDSQIDFIRRGMEEVVDEVFDAKFETILNDYPEAE